MRIISLAAFCAFVLTACSSDISGPPPPNGNDTAGVVLEPVMDNTLYEDPNGALSNGSGDAFFAGRTGQPLNRRALIRFDVAGSTVPSGATIDSVSLTLNMSRTTSNAGARLFGLHRVTSDWGEGASVAPGRGGEGIAAEPNDATWVHRFFDTALWTTPGGDFVPAASATITVNELGFYTWGSTAAMVSDVQGWLDNPGNNFGWLLMGDESESFTAKRFDSRESAVGANRPKLQIFFTQP